MASKSTRISYLILSLIVIIWLLASPVARYLPSDTFGDPFDKVYNGLNVLFTALAFGGVLITLYFQSEAAEAARRADVERTIHELFKIYSNLDFQPVKDAAYRVLLAAVKNRDYAEYVASRLFVVDPLTFPPSSIPTLRALDDAKRGLSDEDIIQADRHDRLMLDNMLNFFAMLAQRESSANVVGHFDFAYDWWRPVLFLVGQLQSDRAQSSPLIQQYCKNKHILAILADLDKIYQHAPLTSGAAVWHYVKNHPKIIEFGLDPRF